MNRLFVIAVTMGGALVTGCSGLTGEPPATSPGAEASVDSTRQAVVSVALEDSLACVQEYVDAGTCDWEHWSELHEACSIYDHPELDDGFFLAEVQAGRCTAANWPTLRARFLAAAAPVLVRTQCDSASAVMQGTEVDGCFTLAGTDASYVSVASGTSVALHAGAGCTGEALVVQADTNLCETSYASGAGTNDNVKSFRIQPAQERPSPARYDCAPDEPTCVKNFNSNLAEVNSTHTVRVVRVTQAGRTTASISDIKNDIQEMYGYFNTASHGQVGLKFLDGTHRTVSVASNTTCGQAEAQARQASSTSGVFLTVIMLPQGLCPTASPPHADSRRIYLRNRLQNIYAHETGHVLGLNHGDRFDATGKRESNADATTLMSRMPSLSYNLPQLHWLGWTKKEQLVQVNSALEDGSALDITLRPVDQNAQSASPLPLGAVWEIPNIPYRLFVAVPRSRTTDLNPVEGGLVFVYRARICEGCTGMAMGTVRLGRVDPKSTKGLIFMDLVITPVSYVRRWIQVDGKSVEVFDSVTLRIRRATPVVLTPAAGTVADSNRPTFSGTAQAGLKVNLWVDEVRVAIPTATAEGTWSFTPTTALTQGAHTVRVSATDGAGTLSPSSSTQTFIIP